METQISKTRLDQLCLFKSSGNDIYSNGSSYVNIRPTGNCQLFLVSLFSTLLNSLVLNGDEFIRHQLYIPNKKKSGAVKRNIEYYYSDFSKKYTYDEEAFTKIMRSISTNITNKPLMLIDIKNLQQYTKFINTYFKGYIVSKQPYKSSNGSNMCIYILNMGAVIKHLK